VRKDAASATEGGGADQALAAEIELREKVASRRRRRKPNAWRTRKRSRRRSATWKRSTVPRKKAKRLEQEN